MRAKQTRAGRDDPGGTASSASASPSPSAAGIAESARPLWRKVAASDLVLRRVRIVEQILADDELVSLLLLRRVALPFVEESAVVYTVSEVEPRVAPILSLSAARDARGENFGSRDDTAPVKRSGQHRAIHSKCAHRSVLGRGVDVGVVEQGLVHDRVVWRKVARLASF